MHTHVFARLARSAARSNGMPRPRQAFVPQPVVDRSAAELRAYIEGNDPVNGGPFMQEVIEGLTAPLDDEDLAGPVVRAHDAALLEPDTEDNLQRLFDENHWTDFLPIVLPTEERVEAMLKGTSHARDEVVGRLRPTAFREFWEFTVEKVAVNAVMAGARPEYLPVILALAASGITARSSSTTSFATIAVVNGPIRNEIGMNSGIGAIGPVQPRQRDDRPRLRPAVAEPSGRLGPGRDLHGLAGQLVRVHRGLRRERGAQPLAAVARAARLQADRQHRQPLLRRLVHAVRHGPRPRGRRDSAARSRRATRSSARSSRWIRSRRALVDSASTRARS